jgi:hypothetical protein
MPSHSTKNPRNFRYVHDAQGMRGPPAGVVCRHSCSRLTQRRRGIRQRPSCPTLSCRTDHTRDVPRPSGSRHPSWR